MSRVPPLGEVADVLLRAVWPALATSTALGFLLPSVFGRRAALIAAALAFLAGIAYANHFRGVYSLRPDSDVPLSALEVAKDFGRTVAGPALAGEGGERRVGTAAGRYWLPWAALMATVAGLLARASWMPMILGWALRVAAAALATRLLVPSELVSQYWWLPWAFAAVVLAGWATTEWLAVGPDGALPPAGAALACCAAAGVLLHAHSARLTDGATILAAALGGVVLASRWGSVDAGGAMPAASVFLPGLLASGQYETFSDVPAVAFALPAFAPLGLALLLMPGIGRITGWKRWAIGLTAVLVPAAAAGVLAARYESLDFG